MYNLKEISALIIIIITILSPCYCVNKYSKEANQPTKLTDRAFRMARINMIWDKAQKRLSANKLQSLFKELKEQDKIEISFKKLKTENQDKNGLKEMEIRSKLNVILAKFDLRDVLEAFDESDNQGKSIESNEHDQKQLFKDKNLDKLWNKALQSKFSEEELKILKEEFQHYEQELSNYHNLIDQIHELEEKEKDENEKWQNSIERLNDDHKLDKSTNTNHLQHLNEKHKSVKSNFNKLQDKVLKKVELDKTGMIFEESDAQKLWNAAKDGNFDENELEIIKRELLHFEHRIKKLNYLHEQTNTDEFVSKYKQTMEDLDENKLLKNRIKELSEQVEKIRSGVEERIFQRHVEL